MIKCNGKDVIPRLNGKELSRVMYNGKQIYPVKKGISPNDAENGVYICNNDGLLYKKEDWNINNNNNSIGIAVITYTKKLLIDKTKRSNIPLSNRGLSGITGITITTSPTEAKKDYQGKENTNAIVTLRTDENSTNNAAIWANEQIIIINGITKNGYIAAAGEWGYIYNYYNLIKEYLEYINGEPINKFSEDIWLSTLYNKDNAYHHNLQNNLLYSYSTDYKSTTVIPIYDIS